MARYESEWSVRDRVHVDGETSITGVVTGLLWSHDDGHTVRVAWLHNGVHYDVWVADWRLSKVAGS